MITIDELQLGRFLGCLMDDYETLSELYKIRDEQMAHPSEGVVAVLWPKNEVYLRHIDLEIEEYKSRASRHQSELSAFLYAFEVHREVDEQSAFEAWAADNLGQGYPLTKDEGTYENAVTRWAFVAWKAGRRELLKGKE